MEFNVRVWGKWYVKIYFYKKKKISKVFKKILGVYIFEIWLLKFFDWIFSNIWLV